MTSQQLAKLRLPDVPGVYIFRDDKKRPLSISAGRLRCATARGAILPMT